MMVTVVYAISGIVFGAGGNTAALYGFCVIFIYTNNRREDLFVSPPVGCLL